MPVLAICPFCSKTISIDRLPKITCPDCGSQFGFAELQKKRLIVDAQTEANEIAEAKSSFAEGDWTGASEHFKKALIANGNSYFAQYFISLCNIYMHEDESTFDVMDAVMQMIDVSLQTLSRANIGVSDKLQFITAMLSETKIIIIRRLASRDAMFEKRLDAYREATIGDLGKLVALFKIDPEKIMSFSPQISAVLMEIADSAIKACYKSVQTVPYGDELRTPNDAIYKQASSLSNEYCYFAHSLDPAFDAKVYSPDFTPNYEVNADILQRFADFDESNKLNAKKRIIGNIEAYEAILADCGKALKFTYLNCYRSMCSRQVAQHAQLFYNGFEMLYRLLLPRVILSDKKRIEIRTAKFVDIVDWCDILTRFLVDSYELDGLVGKALHEFYENLYAIVDMYFVPEFEKRAKYIGKFKETRGEEYFAYIQLLFDCACSCAPALRKYVDFSAEADKTRAKLVKICKSATEDFMLFSGMQIDELEQSNFYRPILQITTALLEEEEKA